MGQAESNESAAVKRQAEGGAIPMYELLDLGGMMLMISVKIQIFPRKPAFENGLHVKSAFKAHK